MHIVHGYMYIDDEQGSQSPEPGVATSLAAKVVKRSFGPAEFEPSEKLAPSNKKELEQFSDPEDFGPFGADPEDPEYNDDSDWTAVQWATVAPGKHYRWVGGDWIVSNLGTWDGFDGTDPEGYFENGRWPQTKKELDTIDPGPAFAAGKFVCLVGRDIGVQYFWDGDKWVEGVAS